MSQVRMADGTTEFRCAECGAPVAANLTLGGCLCESCWDAVIGAELVDLVDDAAPACDHCGRPCDPQAEGTTVYCSLQCYGLARGAIDAAIEHHCG